MYFRGLNACFFTYKHEKKIRESKNDWYTPFKALSRDTFEMAKASFFQMCRFSEDTLAPLQEKLS